MRDILWLGLARDGGRGSITRVLCLALHVDGDSVSPCSEV